MSPTPAVVASEWLLSFFASSCVVGIVVQVVVAVQKS